jgi:hypothetical protein
MEGDGRGQWRDAKETKRDGGGLDGWCEFRKRQNCYEKGRLASVFNGLVKSVSPVRVRQFSFCIVWENKIPSRSYAVH